MYILTADHVGCSTEENFHGNHSIPRAHAVDVNANRRGLPPFFDSGPSDTVWNYTCYEDKPTGELEKGCTIAAQGC
jgi:hypothetical protein